MVFLSQPIPDKQRLLIIDNVDDPTLNLVPFLPRWTDGVVIITSRNVSRGQLSPGTHLQLKVMSLEESVEVLVRGSRWEWPPSEAHKEAATTVAEELGYHPIALVQAAGYISSTGYSVGTYISRLRSYREQLLKDPATNQLDMRYMTAFAAFDASYDILPSKAQNTLHILSFFHRQKFPLELVTLAAENGFSTDEYGYIPQGEEFERGKECIARITNRCHSGNPYGIEWTALTSAVKRCGSVHPRWRPMLTADFMLESSGKCWKSMARASGNGQRHAGFVMCLKQTFCPSGEWNRHEIDPIITSLRNQSLITVVPTLDFTLVEMHSLVHEWSRLRISGTNPALFEAAAIRLLCCGAGDENYRMMQHLSSHVLALSSAWGTLHANDAASFAFILFDSGMYADALTLKEMVYNLMKDQRRVEHPATTQASAELAMSYGGLGRYSDAEVLQVQVLSQRKRLLGPEHPHTIDASAKLSSTYRQLGRYADAEVLDTEVLRNGSDYWGRTTVTPSQLQQTWQ